MKKKTIYLAIFVLALIKSEITWGQKVDCRLVKREITSLCNQLPQETYTTSCEDNSTEILLNKIDALSDQQEALLHQSAASNENSTEILLDRIDALSDQQEALQQSIASSENNSTKVLLNRFDALSDQQEILLQSTTSNENNSTEILLNRIDALSDQQKALQQSTTSNENNSTEILLNRIGVLSDQQEALLQWTASNSTETLLKRIEALSDQQNTDINENNSTEILLNRIDALSDQQQALLQSTASTISGLSDQLNTLKQRLDTFYQLGSSPVHPASSCAAILEEHPEYTSGYYWVKNTLGYAHSVYCDMTRSCGGVTGGWMRVAYLDMTNSSHRCPSRYSRRTDYIHGWVYSCIPSNHFTCPSVWYLTRGIPYSRVCGRVIGYDMGTPDGFYGRSYPSSINSNYVDGVSLTYGRTNRKHIWTFAARKGYCGSRPAFVGNHYFCDGQHNGVGVYGSTINRYNPIWDGSGCGSHSYCHRNNPPWFYRHLPYTTTEDIEMRGCKDDSHYRELIPIKAVEIYIK